MQLKRSAWLPISAPVHRKVFDSMETHALQVRRAAPQVFAELQPLLPEVKNPCFKNATSGATCCLPFLSVIGVSKAGTTDIHEKLMTMRCAPPRSPPRGEVHSDNARFANSHKLYGPLFRCDGWRGPWDRSGSTRKNIPPQREGMRAVMAALIENARMYARW